MKRSAKPKAKARNAQVVRQHGGRRKLGICVLLLGIACAIGLGWKLRSGRLEQRSVLLVTVDTLRADHLSHAGYGRLTSPNLDAFARLGTSFDWALSTCSYTLPSHASMMVGVYPSFHSVGLMNGYLPLKPQELTLAEICRAAGLRTLAVVSNFVLRRDCGLDQGFEVYDDVLPDRELVRGFAERKAVHAMDSALDRLKELGDERFFMWVHLQDPHGPYTPDASTPEPKPTGEAPPRIERDLPVGADQSGFAAVPIYQAIKGERSFDAYRSRYDREILATDIQLGRLFEALAKSGRLKDTLVVITADHGEALGEDNFFFSHSHSVGLDQVHVPLIIAGPGVRAGARIPTAVSSMDTFATILEFLDLPTPNSMHSRSLLSVLQDGAGVPEGAVFTASISQRGIAMGGEFLRTDRVSPTDKAFWSINPLTEGYFAPLGTEGWSLAKPVAERVEPNPGLARRLAEFSVEADAALRSQWPGVNQGFTDEAALRNLRALGYAK